jgi:hypothetical protein
MIFQPNFLPPAKRRRRGWLAQYYSIPSLLIGHRRRETQVDIQDEMWNCGSTSSKKASGPCFCFALAGVRMDSVSFAVGRGSLNRRNRGKVKEKASTLGTWQLSVSPSHIKVRSLPSKLSPPSSSQLAIPSRSSIPFRRSPSSIRSSVVFVSDLIYCRL